jgi:hypothetical protein
MNIEEFSEHGKGVFSQHFPALLCFTLEKLICKSQNESNVSSNIVQEW